jgi:hypothetical protein
MARGPSDFHAHARPRGYSPREHDNVDASVTANATLVVDGFNVSTLPGEHA